MSGKSELLTLTPLISARFYLRPGFFDHDTYKKLGVPPYGSAAGSSRLDFNRTKGAVFQESLVTSHLLVESCKQPLKEPPMSEATKSALTIPTRTESDSMGKIDVPADRYYGAQTARSLMHWARGRDVMPPELIRAFGFLTKADALLLEDLVKLPPAQAALINH